MSNELLTRDQFREAVFARDSHKCVICKNEGQDAHHIIERRLFPDGGYYVANGATLCGACHILAEQTTLWVEEIRIAAGIESAVLPPHLYPDQKYDKWGNPVLANGRRLRGELFYDESVQKIIQPVLHLFTDRVKYPRTSHLPWSPGFTDDDRFLNEETLESWKARKVVITEKMDGECLRADTKITMADGSRLTIRDLVKQNLVGREVLGRDTTGALVPSRITRVYDNGVTKEWLKIRIKGNHGPSRVLYCTPQERVWVSDKEYLPANELKPGQLVRFLSYSPGITNTQSSVLLGKLLGDGSFHKDNYHTAHIKFGHKISHQEYTTWSLAALANLAGASYEDTSGYGTSMICGTSVASHFIYKLFSSMIVEGKKTVPEWVIQKLDPLALAFWYMDDGNLNHSDKQRDRAEISSCGFSESDNQILQRTLARLGISANINHYKSGHPYLYITADGTQRLCELIAPFVPPIMQYKLSSEYRGRTESLPIDNSYPTPWLRESEILGITKQTAAASHRTKYDLETETHNFFANEILVHNCTTFYRDYIHARSLDYESRYDRDRIKAFHATIAHEIPEGWRVCGENLTATHSIKYEKLPHFFLVFSIWDKDTCLGWDETVEYAGVLGLKTVPVQWTGYFGAFSHSYHDECLNFLKQEGYVIRPYDSFKLKEFPFVVGKYVRPGHVADSHVHWTRRKIEWNGWEE